MRNRQLVTTNQRWYHRVTTAVVLPLIIQQRDLVPSWQAAEIPHIMVVDLMKVASKIVLTGAIRGKFLCNIVYEIRTRMSFGQIQNYCGIF